MKEHCTSDRHDGLDASLGHTIVVVCTHASKARDLRERFQMLTVGIGSEGRAVVAQVLRDHNAKVATEGFESFFRFDGTVGVQVHLMLDVDESSGVVHKDGATGILELGVLLPVSVW